MKIENEVTGKIVVRNATYIRVEIYLRGEKIDRFGIYLNNESVEDYLEHNTDKFLGVKNTYEGYAQLVKDLGLEIPESYKKHWIPKTEQKHYYIDFEGDVYPNGTSSNFVGNEINRKRRENFNMFPTRELAEKGKNLSKLGRLILLWQYANDCILTPDWKNNSQRKYYIKHDHINNTISYCFGITAQLDTVYFETEEQVKTFIKMYETEIKKIMGVI